MTIHLEQLEHQEKAVEAVLKAMKDCRLPSEMTGGNSDFNEIYANPQIKLKEENLKNARLPESLGGKTIDVKMETGTGKTYVYTRLMYELYKNFELNKFIIFVPS
jgi:type III restriction enzyme